MSAPYAARRSRRRWRAWGIAAAAVAVVGSVVAVRARGAAVPVARVMRRSLAQTVVASGRVLAPAQVSLGTTLGGVVAEVRVDEGQHVDAGELLVRLRDAELEAATAQAQAGLAQAQARFAQIAAVQGPLAAEELRKAETDLAKAESDMGRARDLFASRSISQAQLEDAEKTLDRAKSQRASALLQAKSATTQGIEGRVSRANVLEAEGALAAARARLADARVTAPASGTILARNVEPGDVVPPGKVLLVMARDGETRLLLEPDERNLAFVRTGQKARASAESFPDQAFDAEVQYVSPSVDASRGTIDVKLRVPQPPEYLRPDMTVSVSIVVGTKNDALVAPAEAVRDPAAPYVLVVHDGRATRASVRIGLRSEGVVELASGVSEGDLVVLAPSVAEGARVRPKVED